MKSKMKKRIIQRRRQQRNIDAMLKDTDKPAGATHFDPKHEVYYKQENGEWFYFEHVWGDFWVATQLKVNLIKLEAY
ncbi:hypothetical protein I2F27_06645 [Acinetobacter sp. B5B]|uniref:hypothetical protein n=1 Tax=Acinetobacter TaxID=469 RepID=UPI0018A265C9|nr:MULTISPECIES: hypothetical protein [Acinetobacter]MBF7683003.1 hypothetical protein [Acinetobacter baretiae]MBF7696175.1 hypothetical protein [Acinetobacter rathckeae]